MTTGNQLKSILSTVTADAMHSGGALGPMANLWELLPEHVAGPQWVGEIVAAADTFGEWLTDEQEYDLDDLHGMTYELADSETEDYYYNINRRVQELSLWASNDLDEEVAASGLYLNTLTDMNAAYLYCAMRGLYYVLAQWAMATAQDMEEVA